MESFALLAYASLAASKTFLQRLLACLNFCDFYEIWQQHKQLETMEMSEAWPDAFDEGYIHQSQPEPTRQITSSSRSTEFKDILPWYIP